MQTIGLIGGMSWESTAEYYRVINERVKELLGGLHSARLLLYSVDFAEVEELQQRGDWPQATEMMVEAARWLAAGGADFTVICTNTMHRMADEVEARSGLPVLHIADATAATIDAAGFHRVGLLGTRYTMEHDFYRGRLERRHGLEVLVPEEEERADVHEVIYGELCVGVIKADSRRRYLDVIARLVEQGAQAVILGCTEIGQLVNAEDADVPLFDTAQIHARAAAERAVGST